MHNNKTTYVKLYPETLITVWR